MPVRQVTSLQELETESGSYMIMDAGAWWKATQQDKVPISKLDVVGIEEGRNLTFAYITTKTVESGKYGGIGTIIVNTFLMVMLTVLFSLPIGVAAALWLCEYARKEG